MKPNGLKISSVLWIVTLIMIIRIPAAQSSNEQQRTSYCGQIAIANKLSKMYLHIIDRTVMANSTNKHYLYSVKVEASPRFYLWDPDAEHFICVKNKHRPKLVAKKIPTKSHCVFEERPVINPYVRLWQRETNHSMHFTKRGVQVARVRHEPRRLKDGLVFLENKVPLDADKCRALWRHFCRRVQALEYHQQQHQQQVHQRQKKKTTRGPTLPDEVKTYCRKK